MTYEFTVTPSPLDAVAAQWHWVGRVRRGIWLAYLGLGGLILIFYLAVRVLFPVPVARTPSHDGPLQWSLIILAVCPIVGTVRPLVNYAVLKRSPAFGPIAYHLDDEGFTAQGAVLEPEDIRAEFDTAFKRFSESLDMMLPDPHALPYANDARWLGKIRATAAARYRDDKLDISDCGAKVRKLIEEAVVAEGIQILVKQVSLFTPEFEDRLKTLKTEDARASEMEHAIRHEIHIKLEENPAFFVSLRERLEQIIEDRKAKRIDAAQQLKLFEALKSELRGHADAAEKLGLTETGFAIYGRAMPDY
jgi:type I restriction enzyme R subunit